MSCQAHDFDKSSLPMSSIYSDVKQFAGSSCQMIWTSMSFARVTLRPASLPVASWAPWIMCEQADLHKLLNFESTS